MKKKIINDKVELFLFGERWKFLVDSLFQQIAKTKSVLAIFSSIIWK